MNAAFICPVCGEPLAREEASLRCARRHTFDIARQGYVNLLLKKPDNLYEDRALFVARRAVYEAGFFDGVIDALRGALPPGPVLDAGCGEGTLLRRVAHGRPAVGLDIARPAVAMAAGAYKEASWCVGDLCALPLAAGSMASIINVLTPANYGEFARVLMPDGLLLKVVPNANHLREIRVAAGKSPYAHTLDEALTVFGRRFTLEDARAIRYAHPCGAALAAQVFAMTPMTAHEAAAEVSTGAITVDVTLLVGRRRAGQD